MPNPISEEHRRYYRLDSIHLVNYEATIRGDENIIEGMAKTENISSGGILLKCNTALPASTEVSIQMSVEENIIRARGFVIRCKKDITKEIGSEIYEIAIRFTDLDRKSRTVIGHLIAGTMMENIKKLTAIN